MGLLLEEIRSKDSRQVVFSWSNNNQLINQSLQLSWKRWTENKNLQSNPGYSSSTGRHMWANTSLQFENNWSESKQIKQMWVWEEELDVSVPLSGRSASELRGEAGLQRQKRRERFIIYGEVQLQSTRSQYSLRVQITISCWL